MSLWKVSQIRNDALNQLEIRYQPYALIDIFNRYRVICWRKIENRSDVLISSMKSKQLVPESLLFIYKYSIHL
jgi:hypothetical protein